MAILILITFSILFFIAARKLSKYTGDGTLLMRTLFTFVFTSIIALFTFIVGVVIGQNPFHPLTLLVLIFIAVDIFVKSKV